jgi:predicted metal-dependent phosphoesterase TrpH
VLSVEFHAHSSLSYDGRDPVELLLEQAAAVGLDALAITDHDEIDASLAAAEQASEYGLVGIPGMEVSSAAGHVLGLGIRERIPAGLSFAETLDRIHEQGGVAVVPHPFQKSRSGVMANITESELAEADAIEVYNSRLLTGRGNRKAKRFAERHGLPQTAGSDAHISEMVGQAVTRIDVGGPGDGLSNPDGDGRSNPDETTDASVDAILDAILDGRTSVEGKRTPWHISFRQAAGGAKRRVKNRLGELLE